MSPDKVNKVELLHCDNLQLIGRKRNDGLFLKDFVYFAPLTLRTVIATFLLINLFTKYHIADTDTLVQLGKTQI